MFINYCPNMFRPQFLAIFREVACYSMCAAYVSTYLVEGLHIFIHSRNMKYPELDSGTISFEERLNTCLDTTNYIIVSVM